jgi:hypothetical protein
MMKGLTKLITLAVIALFLCIPAVSAFSVEGMTIDPSGALTPNTAVTVSFKVGFSASSDNTFPSGSDLVMTTELTNPKWTYTLLLDGVENPRNPVGGKTLDLSGFELSYPSSVDEAVRVTLEGTAPTVDTTTDKILVNIKEIDTNGNTVASSMVNKTAKVINTGDVAAAIASMNTNLQTLRSHIDEKSAIGIDTSEAESQYNEASAQIATAQAQPPTGYEAAFNALAAAQTAITAGETALDRSWAESEVANAQIPINNVDGIIAWFRGNTSTANDAQLGAIQAKREAAVTFLSNANDYISDGKYDEARSKAAEAFTKGNESYTDALARQNELSRGFQFPKINIPGGIFLIIGVIVVVLAVVGFIIYRKRSRWDELG